MYIYTYISIYLYIYICTCTIRFATRCRCCPDCDSGDGNVFVCGIDRRLQTLLTDGIGTPTTEIY